MSMNVDPTAVLAVISDLTNRLVVAEHQGAEMRAALVQAEQQNAELTSRLAEAETQAERQAEELTLRRVAAEE